ncbi:hypothetical protein GALMADRAFT_146105 [Galerina marginata CBS 339.88]|uniref:Nudix hydrolase domain-containing protein n=1 Tax=Galerina marginata (strain CBS 339.88) TaxID=685588 RepID=A0A067SFH0_GALM3|nr:hypothetical protein GALMADRAFT_146105 [Galerina marginata CBS 339.88]
MEQDTPEATSSSTAESMVALFSDENKAYIKTLTNFFTTSKEEQEARSVYLNNIRPTSRLAAVLVLLFERDGQLRVLVTTRGKHLKTHGGQTSLPGGKMEDIDNGGVIATAFREANEEVSLPLDNPHIHTLGTLELHPFHKLVVAPVVALLTDNSVLEVLKARKGEVDHIFSHPLEAFLDPTLAPKFESLVPHGSKHWPYESKYHHHIDYVVEALGGMTYRLHCFQTSASPITGLTADVLIRTAEIVYQREAIYERYAFDQIRSFDALVEAFEKNRKASVPAS